ncbi:HAD family hydrolase [Nocardioides humi]|uniref:Uncharacterized protein n=1 Tax=Nocardioides humi TaxID=449461 RepID=A0ABN2AXR5_9ACTN|nr:HAD family hydrolase [Nocardioides humi]
MNLPVVLLVLLPMLAGLLLPLPAWLTVRRARQEGVEFRGIAALRGAGAIDTVLLDRWGTVTTGELVVSDIDPIEEGNERNLRWFAAALEHASADHPVARAIARLAGTGKVTSVEICPGQGISGAVDRHPVRVGTPSWLGMEARGGLGETVGVEVDHRPFGYLTVTDQIRADAPLAVARLRSSGVEPILLCDGDALNAEHLARSCGIEKWLLGNDAAQREQLVREQRGAGHTIAVVARAAGNTAALAAADVAFTDADTGSAPAHARMPDLDAQRVARVLELARRLPVMVLRTRIAGLLLAAVGALLAALGLLSLTAAVAWAVLGLVVVGLVTPLSLGRRR